MDDNNTVLNIEEIRKKIIDIIFEVTEEEPYELMEGQNESSGEQPASIYDIEDLNVFDLNSISYIQTVVRLEEEFNMEFDDEMLDVELFSTITSIAQYIMEAPKNNPNEVEMD